MVKVKWDRAPQRTKRRNRPRAHLGHSRDVFSLFHGSTMWALFGRSGEPEILVLVHLKCMCAWSWEWPEVPEAVLGGCVIHKAQSEPSGQMHEFAWTSAGWRDNL